MNVPVYGTALIVFALLYLELSAYLLPSIILAILAMAVVLAIQTARLRRPPPPAAEDAGEIRVRALARSRARRSELVDHVTSVVFIGVTWGIFWQLGPHPEAFLGPTVFEPSSGGFPPASPTDWFLAVFGLMAVVAAGATLWYLYAARRAETQIEQARPPMVDPVGNESGVECQFAEAYRFAVGPGKPPERSASVPHSGSMNWITFKSPAGQLPERFAICEAHRTEFVRMQMLTGLPQIATR